MRVQLAYPYKGHKPDEIIEVIPGVGRSLLRYGKARPAPPEPPPVEKPKRMYRKPPVEPEHVSQDQAPVDETGLESEV